MPFRLKYSYFDVDVMSAQTYYPFGMLEVGRLRSPEFYRFGFNEKENDNEVKGTGNQQDFGMRIYDPWLGRFLSADPLIVQQQKHPWYTPCQFAGNTPIHAIDLDGLEEFIVVYYYDNNGKYTGGTVIYVVNEADRTLDTTGVLEVNMDASNIEINNKDYNSSLKKIFFDGSAFKKGKYSSSGSRNKAINDQCGIIKKRHDDPNIHDKSFRGLTNKPHFIGMVYDGSARVSGDAEIIKVANFLIENPDFYITADGMSSPENDTGDPDYNTQKAWQRAEDFKNIILSHGVSPDQLVVTSSGDSKARAAGLTGNNSPGEQELYPRYRGVQWNHHVKYNQEYGTP